MISASHNPVPDNGIKFFAARRPQAARRRRGRDRGRDARARWQRPTGAASAACTTVRRWRRPLHRAPARHASRTGWTGSRSSSTARTAPRPAWSRRGALARRAPRSSSIGAEPDGLNINDELRLDPPREPLRGRGRARRRRRHRPRRRRRPLPRGRRRRDGRRRRPDHGDPRARRCASAGSSNDDTLVATVMSNLGLQLAMEARGHHARRDRGRRPVRARGDARSGGFDARRRAVRPRRHARLRDDRRRRADRAARCWPGWPRPGARWPRWPPSIDRLPQVLVNVAGVDRHGRDHDRGGRRRPSPTAEAELGGPGACCCARPAPSRWCGSWSRRRRRAGQEVADRARRRRARAPLVVNAAAGSAAAPTACRSSGPGRRGPAGVAGRARCRPVLRARPSLADVAPRAPSLAALDIVRDERAADRRRRRPVQEIGAGPPYRYPPGRRDLRQP